MAFLLSPWGIKLVLRLYRNYVASHSNQKIVTPSDSPELLGEATVVCMSYPCDFPIIWHAYQRLTSNWTEMLENVDMMKLTVLTTQIFPEFT